MKPIDEIKNILSMTEAEQTKYFESLPPDGTSTKLVADLEKLPQSETRDKMIARAKAFGYDDFRFTMMYEDCICPKIKLVEDAMAAGFGEIAVNTRIGKYD